MVLVRPLIPDVDSVAKNEQIRAMTAQDRVSFGVAAHRWPDQSLYAQ